MKRRVGWLQRGISGVTAAALLVVQLALPPRAEAAHLGSSTASAGSAPPPTVSAVQSFQPDLFTGRATTSIPITVPPGRKGMQPSLALAYSSSGRNGWIGVGWGLDAGYIERSTKNGVPKYDASDTFTFMFQGVASDLVRIPDGTYRAKDEGLFLRVEDKGVSGWEVRDKSGTRYVFGRDVNSQLDSGGRTFRWCLDQVIDPNGNSLSLAYAKDQNQLYLSQIRYTAHEPSGLAPANQVDFTLEDRPDIETSYRSGFAVTTAKRLAAIAARTTQDAQLVLARRYSLAYTPSPRTGRSLLSGVTQFGIDGMTSLPPVTFTYTQDGPTYLHCHNCVPSISSGNHGWQLQYQVGNIFPRDDGGNDQRLWPSGSWEPGVKNWTEKVCRRRLFWKSCSDEPRSAAIPAVSWSSPLLDLSGSSGGMSWSTDASGNLSVSGPLDSHILAMTWLYTATATTVSLSSLSTSGRADVFYVAPGGSTWSAASGNSVPLSPGWTVVAVTAYSETGGLSLSMSANLAAQVTAMNHAQFSPMGVAGDFNGDGYTDLGHLDPASNHWHVVLNSGSGFGSEQTWLSVILPAATVPLVGDVDADGKADLILWNSSSGQWQVARSTGTSFQAPVTWHSGFGAGQIPFMGDLNGDQVLDVGTVWDGTWTVALSTGTSFGGAATWLSGFGSGAGPSTGDFNGDGLTDVAIGSGGTISVALSDGTRLAPQPSAWMTGFGAGQNITSADLNGDGLSDLVYYDLVSGTVVSAPSTAQGFGSAQSLMSDHPFGLRGTDDRLQVGDFRGNGISGFGVFNALSGAAEIAFALGIPPDLLETTANGLGGSITLTYQPSSQFTSTNLHVAIPVVTKATTADGLGNSYTTTYSYSGGLYDAPTKEFRGFQTATVTDAIGTTTTTTFAQDLHTKGRPLRVEVRDSAGRLFTKTTNTWSCTEPFPGVHFTKLDQTDGFVYDGDASFRQVRSRFTYDQYGNVTTTNDDGQVDPPLIGDERTTTASFAYNTTAWMLNRPILTQTLDAAGGVVAQRRFFYDGATATTTPPTAGNLTKEEEWLNGPTERWLATGLTYDSYGNVTTVTDALNRTTTNTYDAEGTYLLRIRNTLGHTREFVYDPQLGAVTSSTDQNGVTTTTAYDALGRVVKVIGPTDTAALPTIEYEYDLATIPTKIVTHTRVQSGFPLRLTHYTFNDGLGRTIQSRSPAEDPTKQVVTGTVELNTRGLVVKQWVPYLSSLSSSYLPLSLEPSASSLSAVSYTYDPLGRLVEIIDPDGSKSLVDYNDGETTSTLANGTQTQKLVDAYGRLIQVEEVVSETETHTTTYQYDALNNLVKVTDAKGNVTQIAYDSLGRKLSMDDPDMGRWTYVYDAVDNLTSQTDARGVIISFAYDALNRLTQKSYTIPSPLTLDPSPPVTYTYDNPAKPFSKGKLTEVTDGSGSSSFTYDQLGRLITETKMIDGTPYTVHRTHDLLGRLVSLTYPVGDVASYTYNAQGGLETVSLQPPASSLQPIVTDVSYNAAGQLTKIVYGSGVTSDYSYNPQTLRLESLITQHPASSILQDFRYAFDAVGNVTGITDRVHTGTQSFQYDALNRLTQAIGSYGTFSYAYDPIGNMTSKEGVAMTYGLADGSKPHAVTAVHSPQSIVHSLTYDANGNLLQKATDYGLPTTDYTAQRFTYDAENRLIEVKTAPEETVTVTFQPGWNFFSLPVIPEDARISALFPTFSADFEQVAWFDATVSTPTDQRFKHFVNRPKFDDFDTLQYGQGYQLYCTNPAGVTLTITGKLPTRQASTNLLLGWHLLPAVSLQQTAVSTVFGSVDYEQLLKYDTTTGSLTTVTAVKPGEAYFVKVRAPSSWTPPLPKDPSTRFLYDGDGGRVKQITAKGTTTFLGDLVERAPDGTVTTYVFAGSQRIAAIETSPQVAALPPPSRWARLWQRLLDVLDVPVAEAAGAPAIRFYHPDHLGSTDLVTDATGAIVEHTEHVPYGAISRHEVAPSSQPRTPNAFGFTGQRQDATHGLVLFPARAYDPALGRFLQPDPFVQDPSDPQTLNRYSYVRNNPVNFVDPSGNFWQFIIAAIAAVFVVAAVVSVVASTVSLIASATGHENTARRAANVAVASTWVAVGASAVLTAATLGEGAGTMQTAGWIMAYAYTAQTAAQHREEIQQAAIDLGTSINAAMTAAAIQFLTPSNRPLSAEFGDIFEVGVGPALGLKTQFNVFGVGGEAGGELASIGGIEGGRFATKAQFSVALTVDFGKAFAGIKYQASRVTNDPNSRIVRKFKGPFGIDKVKGEIFPLTISGELTPFLGKVRFKANLFELFDFLQEVTSRSILYSIRSPHVIRTLLDTVTIP